MTVSTGLFGDHGAEFGSPKNPLNALRVALCDSCDWPAIE